jgi:methylmalonyl-CoA mutase
MADPTPLFSEFESINKATWMEKVQADLKGQLPESLDWAISEGLKISPFAHQEDIQNGIPAVPNGKSKNNDWAIVETIDLNDPVEANTLALEALQLGAQGLRFQLNQVLDQEALNLLFQDIGLTFISTHFQFGGTKTEVLAQLQQIKLHPQGSKLAGTFSAPALYDNPEALSAALQDWPFPAFQLIDLDGTGFQKGPEGIIEELKNLLILGESILQATEQPGEIHEHFNFQIAVGNRYFLEIAKIRAFKLLWANIMKAYQIEDSMPGIEIHTGLSTQGEDRHTNMIRSSSQAMSAVLGGCDRLLVYPADQVNGIPDSFTRRVARNLQHILKMESHLDWVIDPAAGSYYLEQLTVQLAEKAWGAFQASY